MHDRVTWPEKSTHRLDLSGVLVLSFAADPSRVYDG